MNNVNISAIDRALTAAKARKAVKESSEHVPMPGKAEKAHDKAALALSKSSALAERTAAKEAARNVRSAERAEARAKKATEKSDKKPSHMKKVERALSKLPKLNDATQLSFNEIICNIDASQINALALHLQHHNRQMSTTNAINSMMLTIGATVLITGGDPKFVGQVGQVVKSRQLRAKIKIPGQEKLVYIFTGQAVLVVDNATQSFEATG